MLRKFNTNRTPADNIKLGSLTAFVAGMVNVASVMIFFAFTSNITGHFAVLAEEVSKGNWYQVAIVFGWILLFFTGSFTANFIVTGLGNKRRQLAHALPLAIEIVCLTGVGLYGQLWYGETLTETEWLLAIMLFAMGLQNGLTASISNFSLKTTHLTGTITDLGILFSLFTRAEYRRNRELRDRARLLLAIMGSYLAGGIIAGSVYLYLSFVVFYIVSGILLFIICYDHIKLRAMLRVRQKQTREVHGRQVLYRDKSYPE